MTDPIKPGDGEGEPLTIEKLSEQIKNLNTGIGKYRDDAASAKKEAAEAKAEAAKAIADAAKVRESIEEAKGDDEGEKPEPLAPADQKRLESWAKAQGFVTKAEADAERMRLQADSLRNIETQAVEEFLKQHPLYADEKEFAKVKEQFGLYKQPTSLTGYRSVLSKIYKEIHGDDEATARARAAIDNRKRLALGGGGTGKDDGEVRAQLDEYREKYPHLSEEQIISRLTEINDLATQRAKRKAGKK